MDLFKDGDDVIRFQTEYNRNANGYTHFAATVMGRQAQALAERFPSFVAGGHSETDVTVSFELKSVSLQSAHEEGTQGNQTPYTTFTLHCREITALTGEGGGEGNAELEQRFNSLVEENKRLVQQSAEHKDQSAELEAANQRIASLEQDNRDVNNNLSKLRAERDELQQQLDEATDPNKNSDSSSN